MAPLGKSGSCHERAMLFWEAQSFLTIPIKVGAEKKGQLWVKDNAIHLTFSEELTLVDIYRI